MHTPTIAPPTAAATEHNDPTASYWWFSCLVMPLAGIGMTLLFNSWLGADFHAPGIYVAIGAALVTTTTMVAVLPTMRSRPAAARAGYLAFSAALQLVCGSLIAWGAFWGAFAIACSDGCLS